ncbi:hypothetical protein ACFC09_45395 [Streptomyces sp. NPDC056161]|uniref:hypothetical protein n=1 Tax=Streptomyces sp. NPDC056161 TaxID=3345732 RepID=UPI0035D7B9F3
MAFECGALGYSNERSSLEALKELLRYLESEDSTVSHDVVKEGESWAATTLKISRPGEVEIQQYVQVSVGGEILGFYLEDARESLDEGVLSGRDLMFTTTLSGVTDPIVNDRIMAYALSEWRGIAWDETSGFTSS